MLEVHGSELRERQGRRFYGTKNMNTRSEGLDGGMSRSGLKLKD